jgi:hypothetical protein
MDEQELLRKVSVETNTNIELLKDLLHDDKLMSLIKAGKINEATLLLHLSQPRLGLGGAKVTVEAFATALH